MAVILNDREEVLLCKMPRNRGVFPGQWSLPGGGVEESELVEEALRREIHEELGLTLTDAEPLFFRDLVHTKMKAGAAERLYMIFLVYACRVSGERIRLSPEFDAWAWVSSSQVDRYVRDDFTLGTLAAAGLLP